MAARFKTRNSMAPNESRNLKGSWLRMSKLKTRVPLFPLLVPGPGDRVYKAHDRHDVRQVVSGNDLLQELQVYGAGRPVVHPVGRVRAVGDDVDSVLAPRRLDPAEALSFGRPYASARIPQDLAFGQLL